MRYEIISEDEVVIDHQVNIEYSFDDIEDMYEEAYSESYDDDCDAAYGREWVINHIKDGYQGDIWELIYEMVN